MFVGVFILFDYRGFRLSFLNFVFYGGLFVFFYIFVLVVFLVGGVAGIKGRGMYGINEFYWDKYY